MNREIEQGLRWKRKLRPVAAGFGGLCVAPYHFFHFDQLLADMGARCKPNNPLSAHLLPIKPKHYARLLSTAPAVSPARKESLV